MMCKRTDCLLPSELDHAVERQLLAAFCPTRRGPYVQL